MKIIQLNVKSLLKVTKLILYSEEKSLQKHFDHKGRG